MTNQERGNTGRYLVPAPLGYDCIRYSALGQLFSRFPAPLLDLHQASVEMAAIRRQRLQVWLREQEPTC